MPFKRIIAYVVILLLGIQFQFACNDKKEEDQILSAPVNEPSNNYQVVVEIISFGGLAGCAAAFVEQNDLAIKDAKVTINDVVMVNDTLNSFFENFYADTLMALSYKYFTHYQLKVEHKGKLIAQGSTDMPSIPLITNLRNPYTHILNKALVVKWEKVQKATAIQVVVGGRVYNPATKDSVDREFDSGLIEPTRTSITIPDSLFNLPGTFVLGIVAFNGINPGLVPQRLYDEQGNYSKSYNLQGAAGIFLSAMVYPDPYGLKIVVPDQQGKSSAMAKEKPAFTLKEIVLKKMKKLARQAGFH